MVLADQPSYLLPLGLALAPASARNSRTEVEGLVGSGRSRATRPHHSTSAFRAIDSTVPAARLPSEKCIMAVDWSRRKQADTDLCSRLVARRHCYLGVLIHPDNAKLLFSNGQVGPINFAENAKTVF